MKGLMLHCGGQLATRDEVFAVSPPPSTESYFPLPYQSLITRIEKQLMMEGIKIREEHLALAKNGQRTFGLMQLEIPGNDQRNYGFVLGVRNSYDKSFSTGLCMGATVFVCDNLSFKGSAVSFQRKHTANVLKDLTWLITETVSGLPVQFASQAETFDLYQNTDLSDHEAHDVIVRFYDRGAINGSEIAHVLKEWRTPRHPEFSQCGKNAWRLFNAATETVKGDLWRLPTKTAALHAVLDDHCARRNRVLIPFDPHVDLSELASPRLEMNHETN
ncbi:MAG: DUF932 domain-containing protein [Verrucomicrobiales bacterium]